MNTLPDHQGVRGIRGVFVCYDVLYKSTATLLYFTILLLISELPSTVGHKHNKKLSYS